MFINFVAALLVLLIAAAAFDYSRRPKRYPPGPDLLSLIVSNVAHGFGKRRLKMFVRLHEKYGDVIGLTIGPAYLVMLCKGDDMLELFSRPDTAARPDYNLIMDDLTDDNSNYGIIYSTGKAWVEQRRFCLRTLRNVGLGKRSAESVIIEEVRKLSSRLRAMAGRPLQTGLFFNLAVVNALWSMVAGERYDYDDLELIEIIQLIEEFLSSSNTFSAAVYMIFPGLAKIRRRLSFFLPKKKTWRDGVREKTFHFLRHQIREHESTLKEAGGPRDLIDFYLEKISKTTDPSSSFCVTRPDEDALLVATLADLFGGGSETTSKALMWAFFLLAHHPTVQDAVVKEIRNVVGHREVELADRPCLPYVEAMILEVLRFAPIVPLTIPHSASKDFEFKGYVIPRGAILVGNIFAAHKNPLVWGDPQNFRPERFLSPDKKSLCRRPKAWVAFGTGKRQCLGESLARDELFLFLANLVSNFEITMPSDEPKHSLEAVKEFVLAPEPHNIILNARG